MNDAIDGGPTITTQVLDYKADAACRAFRPVDRDGWTRDRAVSVCQHCGWMFRDHPQPMITGYHVGEVTVYVTLRRLQNPHGEYTTLGVGTMVGTDQHLAFMVDSQHVARLRRVLEDHVGRNGVNVLVALPSVVFMAPEGEPEESVTPGVYVGKKPPTVMGAKPTLVEGQGVVIVRSRIPGHGEPIVYDVVYDPTDLKHRECQWKPGTVITDVPMHDVVANANWRRYKPSLAREGGGLGFIGGLGSANEWNPLPEVGASE